MVNLAAVVERARDLGGRRRGFRRGVGGWWLVAAVGAVVAASFLARPAATATPSLSVAFVAQSVLSYSVAVAFCLRLVRHPDLDRQTRRAWLMFGLAMAFLMAGALAGALAGDGPAGPISLSAVLYLSYYPTVFAGLLHLPTKRTTRRERARTGLDLLLIAVSLTMVSWYFVVGPLLRAGAPNRLSMIVALAYPVGDLAQVCGVVVLLLRRVPEPSRRPLQLLAAGIALGALCDTGAAVAALHQIRVLGPWVGVAGAAANLLIAAAAQTQYTSGQRRERLVEPAAFADVKASRLPYIAVILAYALLLVVGHGIQFYPLGGLIIGAVALTVAVLTRQLTVVHDNRVMALTDGLTGLANRALLYARLTASLDARRGSSQVGILLIDLNKFKPINDAYGHDAGDAVLVVVGQRLRSAVRPSEVVARLGGDEFAVLIDPLPDPGTIMGIADRVLGDLCGPVVYQDQILDIAASIGAATSSPETTAAEDLIHRADVAMYAAKRSATNTYRLYTADLAAQDPRRELQQAIERGEFVVHYEPIVDLRTGDLVGLKALVRRHHPTRGLLPESNFAPTAEESGLMAPLGAWVLDHVSGQLQEWHNTLPGAAGLILSLDVPALLVCRPGFVAELTAVLNRYSLRPTDLILELTNDASLSPGDDLRTTTEALRGLGIRIAVDAFGNGHCGLTPPSQVPVDILKINRSLVKGLPADDSSRILSEAIARLGRALNLDVTAEGVDTQDQHRALERLSCSHGRGAWFGRPQDTTTTTNLLAQLTGKPRQAWRPRTPTGTAHDDASLRRGTAGDR